MQIQSIEFEPSLRDHWDAFIWNEGLNSTLLHSRPFFEHNPLNAPEESSLLFYKKNEIIAVLPANIYSKNGLRLLHSHPRATYGGFVISKNIHVESAIEIVALTISHAKKNHVDQILIRNPFRIYHRQFCDETDYAMWYHGFEIISREIEIAISLEGSLTRLREKYHKDTRLSLKKSQRFVSVRLTNEFDQYWQILERNLLTKYGKLPTHDLMSIKVLREKVSQENVQLFAAYLGPRLIAGIVIFIASREALHAQYMATDYEFQEFRPLNAIVDYIIEYGKNSGFKYLNLGMGNENDGKEINAGLFRFKEGFGGRGILRETMSLIL